jgi:hypothetical protein
LFVALSAGIGGATTIYDNTAGSQAGRVDIGCLESTCRDIANSFLTPSGAVTVLSKLGVYLSAGTQTGYVTALLYSSTTGSNPVPNSPLATLGVFTHDQMVSSPGMLYVTPAGPVTLTPSTEYWIVLVGGGNLVPDNNYDGRWRTTNSNSGVGVAGQYHANWTGSSWFSKSNTTLLGTPQMSIEVSAAVPEPCTLGATGIVLAVILALRGKARARRPTKL